MVEGVACCGGADVGVDILSLRPFVYLLRCVCFCRLAISVYPRFERLSTCMFPAFDGLEKENGHIHRRRLDAPFLLGMFDV